jgi:hypothetical protein
MAWKHGSIEAAKCSINEAYRADPIKSPFHWSCAGLEFLPELDWDSALDFGCGIGRNLVGLHEMRPDARLVGYDNDSMIGFAEEFMGEAYASVKWLSYDSHSFTELEPVDLTVAVLVFQHICDSELERIAEHLGKITRKWLYVVQRNTTDDGKDSWTHLLKHFQPSALTPERDEKPGNHSWWLLEPIQR